MADRILKGSRNMPVSGGFLTPLRPGNIVVFQQTPKAEALAP